MSDGPGSGRNYWQVAAKELEEEKQMLQAQVAALTTENANLAALVGELREALVEFARVGNWWKNAQIPAPRNSGNIFPIQGHVWNDGREPWRIAQQALARTPEQAGARMRAEQAVQISAMGLRFAVEMADALAGEGE